MRALPYGAFRARAGLRRQRGVTAVLAAIWIGVAVAAMGVLDVGNVYMMRRQTQQIADMAAVAGAQTIGMAGGCATATTSAQQAATANGVSSGASVSVTCGRWTTAGGFDTSGATPLNAVRVTASQPVRHFFIGPAANVQAVATAKATDTTTFSLTTSLASLSGGAVNGLLSSLLGANISLDIATYQALASTSIKIGDLATQLGAASVNQLLNSTTTVSNLAGAMISVLNRNNVVNASVTAGLATIQAAAAGGAKLALGDGGAGSPGMLQIGLADTQAAASASISALDALLIAAELAHGTSALDLSAALNPAAIPGVTLPVGLTAKAMVLQPPVIAVGEAGNDASGNPRTSAHSAQVRVFLELTVNLAPIATVDLPLAVESANGTANLTQQQCTNSKATSTSTITIPSTNILQICSGADAWTNFTNTTKQMACKQPVNLATLTALGVAVGVGPLNLPLGSTGSFTYTFNGIAGDSDDYQPPANANPLGSATGSLLGQTLTGLLTTLTLTIGGVNVVGPLLLTVQPVVQTVLGVLQPLFSTLDAVIVPLLQLLGLQVGVSTVHMIGMSCSDAQLVN
jgi:uncharacterized membrane protein